MLVVSCIKKERISDEKKYIVWDSDDLVAEEIYGSAIKEVMRLGLTFSNVKNSVVDTPYRAINTLWEGNGITNNTDTYSIRHKDKIILWKEGRIYLAPYRRGQLQVPCIFEAGLMSCSLRTSSFERFRYLGTMSLEKFKKYCVLDKSQILMNVD